MSWLDAADRAAVRALPDGYTLVARPEQDGPHPMIKRNGANVEARLRDCSLYDPELDLALLTDDGAVAGYAMFWADRRTCVGLVEPMRIEDMHSGRGLAGTLLRAGLDKLAARAVRPFQGEPRSHQSGRGAGLPRRGLPHSSARRGVPTHDRPHPENNGLFRVGGQTVGSNNDQQISLRKRWSSRTSSRIASGSCSRCQRHSSRPAPSVVPAGAAARAALIA